MPNNDKDVWEYFSNGDDDQQVDFLAFSSFSFDKFEWMEKFAENHGQQPTEAEINKWISELPDSRLDEMREWAQNFFENAARAYLEEEHKEALQQAINSALVVSVRDNNEAVKSAVIASNEEAQRRVEGALSFKNTWLPNVFLGVISSFLFAILIVLASIIFTKDPSPIALIKSVSH